MKQKVLGAMIVIMSLSLLGCPGLFPPPATYNVTYDDNESTGGTAPVAQTKTEGVDLVLATNSGSLVRTGYAFAGWNTAANGSGTDYAEDATYTANAALGLFAKWTVTLPTNIVSLEYVPAGSFQRDATVTNISTITTAYWMGRYEITRDQFSAIMGTDPSDGPSTGTSDPVHDVNWYHAIAFANKLSLAEGLTPVYSVGGVDFSTLTFAMIPTASSDADWNAAAAD